MKLLLVLFFFSLPAFSAEMRVFFFKETSQGATFRVQCVANPPENRCLFSEFRGKGEELCASADLELAKLSPFACVEDLESSKRRCKYVNGDCLPGKAPGTEGEKGDGKEREIQEPKGIPDVSEFPDTQTLPPIPPPGDLRPIPEVQNLPPVKELGGSKGEKKERR